MPRALISGLSIAGPVAGHWLTHAGWDVDYVEAAPAPRRGGQAIDVRGAALEVMRRMGLEARLIACRTQLGGMSALDRDSTEVFRSTEETMTGGRFDAGDVEILREDLTDILIDGIAVDHIRFADSIAALDQDDSGVDVTFRSGTRDRYDLVIGADGLGSPTRRLAFGPDAPFLHPVGYHLAFFTVPNMLGLKDWQIVSHAEDGGYVIYTARENSQLRVSFGFPSRPGDDVHGADAQRALVRERCAGFGWRSGELLTAMGDAPDFYYGPMAQVKMERWQDGRVVLVGDAGYCPSPMTGQGSSLAIVGGYLLAREVGGTPDDLPAALARYEARMRPYVEANQAILGADDAQDRIAVAKNAISL